MLLENYKIHRVAYRDYQRELEELYGQQATDADWNFYEFPDEFYEDEMVIWIDPLDGTKGFTEGHLHHITSLIGVAVNNRPRIGIIHKPFYNEQYQQGRTYFGTPQCGIFIKDKFPEKLKRLQRVTPLMPFHTEDTIEDEEYSAIDACLPENISRVAGAGNKFIHLLDGKADYYMNLVPGFKYWDMCASEALIQAKMGIVTDANRMPLIYDDTKDNFTLREGIIVAKNKKVYEICENRIQRKLGKTISDLHQKILEQSNIQRAQRQSQPKQKKVISIDVNQINTQDPLIQANFFKNIAIQARQKKMESKI